MTLDELDKKAGELFELLNDADDDPKLIKTACAGLSIAVELVADIKRMTQQFELLNQALTAIVDLQALEYTHGKIVKVHAPIEIFTQGVEEQKEEGASSAEDNCQEGSEARATDQEQEANHLGRDNTEDTNQEEIAEGLDRYFKSKDFATKEGARGKDI